MIAPFASLSELRWEPNSFSALQTEQKYFGPHQRLKPDTSHVFEKDFCSFQFEIGSMVVASGSRDPGFESDSSRNEFCTFFKFLKI